MAHSPGDLKPCSTPARVASSAHAIALLLALQHVAAKLELRRSLTLLVFVAKLAQLAAAPRRIVRVAAAVAAAAALRRLDPALIFKV